nr:MAG TPA: hypothetical protein [Caudoviricetes sp.]
MNAQQLASLRNAIYSVAVTIGAIGVANGIITGEQLEKYLPTIPEIFALIVAILNVRPHAEPINIDELASAVVAQAVNIMPAPAAPTNPNGDHYDPQASEKLTEYLLDKPSASPATSEK